MRIGIIGAGAIGTEVGKAALAMEAVTAIFVTDLDPAATSRFMEAVPSAVDEPNADAVIAKSDLVLEMATIDAARDVVPRALAAGKDVLMMSVGVLADEGFKANVEALAREHGCKIYLPSGAIAGVDGVKAGALGGLKSVTLVTTKPPRSLGIEVDQWTLLFSGSARDAIAKYPQNVNVALCLSLAGLGADETWVQVVADPLATHNKHKLIVEGQFGRIRCEVENLPSPDNPKTSYLASLSAIATLHRILDPIQIGS